MQPSKLSEGFLKKRFPEPSILTQDDSIALREQLGNYSIDKMKERRIVVNCCKLLLEVNKINTIDYKLCV